MNKLTLTINPTLQQEMAFAVLRSTSFIISRLNIIKAAGIMGKVLSAETLAFLDALNACGYSDCGPKILERLEALGAEILEIA